MNEDGEAAAAPGAEEKADGDAGENDGNSFAYEQSPHRGYKFLMFLSDLDLENFGKKKKKKKPVNLDDLKEALPDDDDLDLESFGKKKKKKKRGDATLDEAQDDNKENGERTKSFSI